MGRTKDKTDVKATGKRSHGITSDPATWVDPRQARGMASYCRAGSRGAANNALWEAGIVDAHEVCSILGIPYSSAIASQLALHRKNMVERGASSGVPGTALGEYQRTSSHSPSGKANRGWTTTHRPDSIVGTAHAIDVASVARDAAQTTVANAKGADKRRANAVLSEVEALLKAAREAHAQALIVRRRTVAPATPVAPVAPVASASPDQATKRTQRAKRVASRKVMRKATY